MNKISCHSVVTLLSIATLLIANVTQPSSQTSTSHKAKKKNLQEHPIPSVWRLLAHNKIVTPEDKKRFFASDCTHAKNTNTLIPKHTLNSASVRLAQKNVRYWTNVFGEKNYEAIMADIKKLQADVLVLQEMHLFDNRRISSDLVAMGYKHHAFFIGASFNLPYGKAPFGTLITSKYPFAQPPTHTLFTIDQARGDQRGFVNARIQLPHATIISLYGTHLNAFDTSEEQHEAEIDELLRIIKEDETPNVCIMLASNTARKQDHNYTLNGKLVWDFLQYDDHTTAPHPKKQPVTIFDLLTQAGFTDCFTKANIIGPKFTSWSAKVLDHIFLSTTWNLPIAGCYNAYLCSSDHCALILDVLLQKKMKK